MWRVEEWGNGSPIAPVRSVHGRYEEGTVSPKALDRDKTPEAADFLSSPQETASWGYTSGAKNTVTVPFIDAKTKPAQRGP